MVPTPPLSLFTWKSSAASAPTWRDKVLQDTAGVFLFNCLYPP